MGLWMMVDGNESNTANTVQCSHIMWQYLLFYSGGSPIKPLGAVPHL